MTSMKLSNYLIAFVLVSVCVTAYLTLFSTMADRYGVDTDASEFQATYNVLAQISNNTDELYNSSVAISADEDAQYFTGIWSSVKNTGKLIKNTAGLGKAIITDTSTKYIVFPEYIMTAIQIILVILVIGAFIYLITKVKW